MPEFIGGKIFQFIGPFFRSKKIIHLNIKRAFPNLEQKEIDKNSGKDIDDLIKVD